MTFLIFSCSENRLFGNSDDNKSCQTYIVLLSLLMTNIFLIRCRKFNLGSFNKIDLIILKKYFMKEINAGRGRPWMLHLGS